MPGLGPSTRAVHAGLPPAAQGAPFLPGPVLAAPYHLEGPKDATPYGYARDANPTLEHLESAVGALEGGYSASYPSGMAAVTAAIEAIVTPGGVLVAPDDGYPGIRRVAREQLEPWGVEVRFVPTDTDAILDALPGATAVWLETPSNPALDVCDVRRICAAAREAGARVAVDNTLPTPLLQRPLELGADVSVLSGTKALSGHSDLLLGIVTVREAAQAAALRHTRARTGALPGPFEAWLAHRSLATLAVRLERQQATALALARTLNGRRDVRGVRYPGLPGDPSRDVATRQMDGYGPVLAFELAGEDTAQAFLADLELVAEATSFGGVHATAERRARWGTDHVSPGFIRFSCGIEDTADVLADVTRALDALR